MALRFGVVYDPPSATYCALDPVCPQRGCHIDAINIACKAWNVNCTFSWYNGTFGGANSSTGIGTGLIGAIQRGEFDASLPVLTMTRNRFKAIAFSKFYEIADIVLFTRAPSMKHSLDWSMVHTFGWPVWICLFSILFLATTWIALTVKIIDRPSEKSLDSSGSVFSMLLTSELVPQYKKRWSIRLFKCIWLFSMLVLTSAYSGVLFSITLIHKHDVPFTNLETFVECLERRQCRIVAQSIEFSGIQLLVSNGNHFGARIRKNLLTNPVKLVPRVDEIPGIILREKKRYLVGTGSKLTTYARLHGNRNCTFYVVDLPQGDPRAFGAQKKSKYLPFLDKIATIYREQGLQKAVTLNYSRQSLCEEPWVGSYMERRTDTLFSTSTIFMFYWIGLLIATAAFVVEKYLVGFNHKPKTWRF